MRSTVVIVMVTVTFILAAIAVRAAMHPDNVSAAPQNNILTTNLPEPGLPVDTQRAIAPHLGYGFNVASLEQDKLRSLGFDWVKLFGAPGARLEFNVLQRVDVNSDTLNDLGGFEWTIRNLAREHGSKIEAYEIGNELNLDASYGWAAPPRAEQYVTILCSAYREIKAEDPDSVVVSAGVAPVGRVTGDWEGRKGHNGLFQDEREWFREFIAAGGAACADAIGYHPYGFRADFDAEPDLWSADPEQQCVNGFCFRGVEKFYDIMEEEGIGDMQVWATEWGWIVEPPENCLSDGTWAGRQWQMVSAEKQATNLAGAYQYADANWPWMGPMFIFNLNFNTVNYYDQCEQMRFYGVDGRPAEAALRDMPKRYASDADPLVLDRDTIDITLFRNELPQTRYETVTLSNETRSDVAYAVAVDSAEINIISTPSSGTLPRLGSQSLDLTIALPQLPTGKRSGRVVFSGENGDSETTTIALNVMNPLKIDTTSIGALVLDEDVVQPIVLPLRIQNLSLAEADYAVAVSSAEGMTVNLSDSIGVVGEQDSAEITLSILLDDATIGTRNATLTITSTVSDPIEVPLSISVADEIFDFYLPTIYR